MRGQPYAIEAIRTHENGDTGAVVSERAHAMPKSRDKKKESNVIRYQRRGDQHARAG